VKCSEPPDSTVSDTFRSVRDDVFAYDEYVEKLEAMGIKPKNVC